MSKGVSPRVTQAVIEVILILIVNVWSVAWSVGCLALSHAAKDLSVTVMSVAVAHVSWTLSFQQAALHRGLYRRACVSLSNQLWLKQYSCLWTVSC